MKKRSFIKNKRKNEEFKIVRINERTNFLKRIFQKRLFLTEQTILYNKLSKKNKTLFLRKERFSK